MNILKEFLPWYPLEQRQEIAAAYQEVLTQDGIIFPDEEQLRAARLLDAHAAQHLGRISLNEDGSLIDLSDFDPSAAREQLNGYAGFENAIKLESLVDLSLLSRAVSACPIDVATIIQRPEAADESREILTTRGLVEKIKQFVQVHMALEEWATPWQELVYNGFEGESLQFPLAAAEIRAARENLRNLHQIQRAPLSGNEHFRRIGNLTYAVFNGIRSSLPKNHAISTDDLFLAADIGIHFRTSPEGTKAFFTELVNEGRLSSTIDWHKAAEKGAEWVAPWFPASEQ